MTENTHKENQHEQQVLDLYRHLLTRKLRSDRTGVGTHSSFGHMLTFDLADGFPLLTTKRVPFKAVASELIWFIEGSGDERRLAEILHGTRDSSKTTIWTANAEAPYWKPKAKFEGDLGRVYGVQWRTWLDRAGVGIDQLMLLVTQLQLNPTDRRMLVSAWNPGEIPDMALPPCHVLFQAYVDFENSEKGKVCLNMYQRSCDAFLGLPFNIASYALFVHILASISGREVGTLNIMLGDVHIYANHIEQVQEQLSRAPRQFPTLALTHKIKDLSDVYMSTFQLTGYDPYDTIKAPMAV